MNKSIFEYKKYKKYLKNALGAGRRTGLKMALAKHIRCQTTYISQVLNKSAHFNLEQAYLVCEFLQLSDLETEYFLLLIQKERASHKQLIDYLNKKIELILNQHLDIKKRVISTRELSEEDKTVYYSHWLYLAVHIAVGIQDYNTKAKLTAYLSVDTAKLNQVLDFLLKVGLIEQVKGEYRMGPCHMHLESSSHLIQHHHLNWRLKALTAVEKKQNSNMHYSMVCSLAKKDVGKIKDQFIKIIKENNMIIGESKEEVLFCNVIDFFEV